MVRFGSARWASISFSGAPLGIDTPQSLLEEQHRDVERALWAAVRTLRERAALLRRLAGRSGTLAADSFNEKADL